MKNILAPLFEQVNSAPCCVPSSNAHNPVMEKSKKSKIEPFHIEESERLKALYNERVKDLSQAEFGAKYDIGSQGMVWQYLNAKSPLNLLAATKFAQGIGCQISDFSERLAAEYMRPGQSIEMITHRNLPEKQNDLVSLTDHPDLFEVPRVKFKLSAGVSGFAIDVEEGNGKPIFFRQDWFTSHGFRPENLFAVRISGQSMEPRLWEGDLVVINTSSSTPTDGEPFALNYEGELVIKQLRRDAGEWWACSDNPDQQRYAPKRCTEDVKIIGMVVYRQGERI